MLTRLVQGIGLLKRNQETSCVSNLADPREKTTGVSPTTSHAKKETRLEIDEKSKQKLKESIRRIF
jgi:RNA-directed DNA polymerase